jgi:glyoxalase/bleomycin resistance protein/dioxygenase superfamily protein
MYSRYYALTDIDLKEALVARLQLALNVSDLDGAIEFYTTYFRTPPAKVRPGYANFAIDEPPLKLVLMEGGTPGTINHLGVEVFSTDEVAETTAYLTAQGLATDVEEQTTCCFAVQNKVWTDGPDGTSWETYVVISDAESTVTDDSSQCCSTSVSGSARCC